MSDRLRNTSMMTFIHRYIILSLPEFCQKFLKSSQTFQFWLTLTIIGMLPTIFIINYLLRRLAQLIMNRSQLILKSIIMKKPENEKDNKFTMHFKAELRFTGPFHAIVCCPQPISLCIRSDKYQKIENINERTLLSVANLDLPNFKINPAELVQYLDLNNVPVQPNQNFAKLGQQILHQTEFQMNLNGNVSLKTMGLSLSNINFNKMIHMKGNVSFINFDQFNIYSHNLLFMKVWMGWLK